MKALHSSLRLFLFTLLLTSCGRAQSAGSKSEDTWTSDYTAALKRAQETGRYVLVDFTGSDWCGWCIRLVNEVFSKSEFNEFSAENLINVEIDFPRQKELSKDAQKKNEELAQKYNIRGFPTIVILSPEGELVQRTGYRRGGVEAYVKHLQEIITTHRNQ